MSGAGFTDRVARALAPVVAVLLVAGGVAAVSYGESSEEASATPPTTGSAGTGPTSVPSSTVAPTGSASAASDPPAPTTSTTQPPLGRAAVPTPGTYAYDVDSVHDGATSTRRETREISILGEGDGVTTVQIVVDSEGERQVSVLDWGDAGASVRTTRIEASGQSSRDCTWEPAFPELGVLEAGSVWSVDSTCTTDVAGLPTRFVVSGSGRVAGEIEVVQAGVPVRAWQVERDRTTIITATVGDETIEQQVREVGTFFIDPARGLVLRSDVTVTLSGSQQGTTRRTSVLVEG